MRILAFSFQKAELETAPTYPWDLSYFVSFSYKIMDSDKLNSHLKKVFNDLRRLRINLTQTFNNFHEFVASDREYQMPLVDLQKFPKYFLDFSSNSNNLQIQFHLIPAEVKSTVHLQVVEYPNTLST
jgi:hypothetical protein